MPVQPYRQRVKCHAKRQDGEPCTNWAARGQQVCMKHGGRAGQNKDKALDREAERKAQYWLGRLGVVKPVTNHLEALRLLAGEILQWKDEH